MKKSAINYKPRKGGAPYKLLKYLQKYGKSSGVDAQEGIGLNKWANKKGAIFFDRASINFDAAVRQLQQRKLIRMLPNDEYELTKSGTEFIENYYERY